MKTRHALTVLLAAGLVAFAVSSAKRASQPETAVVAVPVVLDRAESIARSHLDGGTLHGVAAIVRSWEDPRTLYSGALSYQVALRDLYGPFKLVWWRPGENGASEFLFEGPDGRALRFKLGPSDADPAVTSTFSVATMDFDEDGSLYEELSGQ